MKFSNRQKIAYYSINDPLDKRSWSGTTYYLGQTLQKNIGNVDFLGPVKIPWLLDKIFRALQKLSRFLFKTEWIPKYSLLKNIYAAFILKRKMKGQQYNFIIAPAAASELAYLKTDLPVIYLGDATFKIYSETYKKEFKDVSPFSIWEGDHLEKKALQKSTIIIFSSRWAAQSAINDYGVPTDKIKVIQLGANIDFVPCKDTIFKKEENKTLTLLFLSVDWDRKGGPIAFEALKQLHRMGIEVKLIVCGCVPPAEFSHPNMEVIPFLNKKVTKDFERLVHLLTFSHFLLLPTRADCTPMVNCEANAYGIPAITTDVGGISGTVIDGVNGYCLPFEAGGSDYASLIVKVYSDKERYHKLIESSRARFDEELNWNKFAEHFQELLKNYKLSAPSL